MNDEENGDPAYIRNLFDPNSDHSCYFMVGDPIRGTVERIGVVSPMLMAHSLVLRRVLSVLEIDMKNRWDIPLPDIQPSTFKNLLRFAYGFNNIDTYSMTEAVELLKVADRLMMQPMLLQVSKHIVDILTPNNVCLALIDPVCLHVNKVKQEIAEALLNDPVKVLGSQDLERVSPHCMRYIVLLEHMPQSEVWKAVIKWARRRVLRESLPAFVHRLEPYVLPKLLLPSLKHIKTCSLNVIQLVEDAYSNDLETKDYPAFLCGYHHMTYNSSKGMIVCIESSDSTITHKQFDVEVIHDCSSWIDSVLIPCSELVINTRDTSIDLYSVVCTAKKYETITKYNDEEIIREAYLKKELGETVYECELSLKTILVKNVDEEELVSEIRFKEEILYGELFQIPVCSDGGLLKLQPNSSYRLEIEFTKDHPLWYTHDIDDYNPDRHKNIVIDCGLVNEACLFYGTHIKFVLYRPVNT